MDSEANKAHVRATKGKAEARFVGKFPKMENHKELFKEVFGESSDSENDPQQEPIPSWEQIEKINGLWLCRDFLSSQQQSSLISAVLNEGWFTEDSHNQAMRFGDLPAWATELAYSIREAVLLGDHVSESTSNGGTKLYLLPSNLLWREPLFDQLIVNVYHPGEVRHHFGVVYVVPESSNIICMKFLFVYCAGNLCSC
ncbi:hypothetical protein DITRI_Ditri11bG0106800 [Diplodiscus trichospermus]